ncbi:MAG TPA: tetratricopeptide repeat protein [Oscillatoriaceae cyanobacterium]
MSLLNFLPPGLLWLVGIATPILQILAAIHVLRTGRNYFWLWIILFFPLLGALIYLLAEVLPYRSPTRLSNPFPALLDAVIPGRELRRLQENLARSNTVTNRQQLAEYYVRRKQYDEAVRLYESCLSGVFRDDPDIYLNLARVHVLAGNHAQAQPLLDKMAAIAPAHETQKRDYWMGRIAEETGDRARALAIYDRMRTSGPINEETRVRLAGLLEERGERERAKELYTEVVRRMRSANNNYRREQKDWLSMARARLRQLAS